MATIQNCSIQRNRTKVSSCQYTLNKVTKIYLASISDVSGITTSGVTGGCGEEVASISLESGKKWYMIEPATDSASFTDVLNVASNDVRYRTHTLSFSISGEYDGEAVCDLNGLSLGEYIAVAVTANGNGVLLGTKNVGLKATTATLTGSATSTDFSGMQFEMSADVTASSLPLKADALTAVETSAKDE